MSADLFDLSAARRARAPAGPVNGVSLELESRAGEVCFAMVAGPDGLEAWLSPDEADELAARLTRHASVARGAAPPKCGHVTTKDQIR